MTDFGIRIATKSDAPVLAEFNRLMAFETEAEELERETLLKGVSAVFDDSKKGFYVVAESADSEILGGLLVFFEWSDWRNAWYWWIASVFVKPEVRGLGVYRDLYRFVKRLARQERNVFGIRLYVDIDNTNAQKVYERVGMTAGRYLIFGEKLE